MMLVQLPAMDAVPVPALPSLPSWPSFLSSSGPLPKPSLCVWLVLLVVSLVILSTIRAAFLYARPPRTSTGGKLGISIVRIASDSKVPSGLTAATVASVSSPSALELEPKISLPSSTAQDQSSKSTVTSSPKEAEKKVSSWLFGLVKWEALPALPTIPSLRQTNRNTLSISQTERGGWLTSPPPHQQHHMRQSSRRFNRPPPSPSFSLDTPPGPPVSMAKMIMSRHTFRRPASRPPPVRSANAVQYQRKFVGGGESV